MDSIGIGGVHLDLDWDLDYLQPVPSTRWECGSGTARAAGGAIGRYCCGQTVRAGTWKPTPEAQEEVPLPFSFTSSTVGSLEKVPLHLKQPITPVPFPLPCAGWLNAVTTTN